MKVKSVKYWLKSKERLFSDFSGFVLDGGDVKRRRIFIDRQSEVLFVAHIDTVLPPKYIRTRKRKSGKIKRLYAQGLDDRLGCMVAYELSEELNADLLLCDHEEEMRSTGQYHDLKEYNWIAEFDRGGEDVVTYGLDTEEFLCALGDCFVIGDGSFSDLCVLKTIACCVNVGIGYVHAHSRDSYVNVGILDRQIARFREFYETYQDTKFEQDNKYNDWMPEEGLQGDCELCGSYLDVQTVFSRTICRECFYELMEESLLFCGYGGHNET